MSHTGLRSSRFILPTLAALVLIVLVAGVSIGPVTIPWSETIAAIFGSEGASETTSLIIHQVRLPRVLLGFLVGSALAVSGTVMQGLFRNPLGSPYLLGVASGAAAGAAVAVLAGWRVVPWLPLSAFAGGVLAMGIVYALARTRDRRTSIFTLILAGVAVGALFSAVTSFAIFLSTQGERLADLVFWIMGGLGRATWAGVGILTPVVVVGTVWIATLGRHLNALALGEEGAYHLGVDPVRVPRLLLALTTLLTAASVAYAGTIGFVGLIVPHMLRLLLGPNHRTLIPASALGGGLFLVAADIAARTLLRPIEIPVGILTAFLGAPFFLYLLKTQTRRLP